MYTLPVSDYIKKHVGASVKNNKYFYSLLHWVGEYSVQYAIGYSVTRLAIRPNSLHKAQLEDPMSGSHSTNIREIAAAFYIMSITSCFKT